MPLANDNTSSGRIYLRPRKKCLNFGTDPDLDLDQGLFFQFSTLGEGHFWHRPTEMFGICGGMEI